MTRPALFDETIHCRTTEGELSLPATLTRMAKQGCCVPASVSLKVFVLLNRFWEDAEVVVEIWSRQKCDDDYLTQPFNFPPTRQQYVLIVISRRLTLSPKMSIAGGSPHKPNKTDFYSQEGYNRCIRDFVTMMSVCHTVVPEKSRPVAPAAAPDNRDDIDRQLDYDEIQ